MSHHMLFWCFVVVAVAATVCFFFCLFRTRKHHSNKATKQHMRTQDTETIQEDMRKQGGSEGTFTHTHTPASASLCGCLCLYMAVCHTSL